MSGRVELDSISDRLRIGFPYDPRLVDLVRGLEGRRFNPVDKCWYVPAESVREVVDSLHQQRFTFQNEVLELYRSKGGTHDFDPQTEVDDSPSESLSVSQVNNVARDALRRQFPDAVWVVGEISGFDKWRHKRHAYFQLIEKPEGDDHIAASISIVLFEQSRGIIEERLKSAESKVELQDGIGMRFLVRVDLFARTGSFQLIIEDVDPLHTLGQLALKRERILKELRRRGLMEKNRSLPMPLLPLRIGLITSLGSDAFNDFMSELKSSGYGFEVLLCGAMMQGAQLEKTVLAGLKRFESMAEPPDVVVVTRGGGSKTDLSWFDSLELALRVAEYPIKVLCGIGHHRDVSVIDLIAHSEKTPTAIASFLVERVRQCDDALREAQARLSRMVEERFRRAARQIQGQAMDFRRLVFASLRRENFRMSVLVTALPHRMRAPLRRGRLELSKQSERVIRGATRELRGERRSLESNIHRYSSVVPSRLREGRRILGALGRQMLQGVGRALVAAQRNVDHLQTTFTKDRIIRPIARSSERMDALEKRLSGLDPKNVLARGFAWIQNMDGGTIRRVDDVLPGERLSARLIDGRLEADVVSRFIDAQIVDESPDS